MNMSFTQENSANVCYTCTALGNSKIKNQKIPWKFCWSPLEIPLLSKLIPVNSLMPLEILCLPPPTCLFFFWNSSMEDISLLSMSASIHFQSLLSELELRVRDHSESQINFLIPRTTKFVKLLFLTNCFFQNLIHLK